MSVNEFKDDFEIKNEKVEYTGPDYNAYIRDHIEKQATYNNENNQKNNDAPFDYKAALQAEIEKERAENNENIFDTSSFTKNHPEIKNLHDYLEAISGRDSTKEYLAKATSVFQLVKYKTPELGIKGLNNPKNFDLLVSRDTQKPEPRVTITPNGFCFVDLVFVSAMDPELKLFFDELENFGQLSSISAETSGSFIPFASVQIMGDEFIGESYLCFSNPVYWTLLPESPGLPSPNMIRILFREDDMELVMLNAEEENIDLVAEAAYMRRMISDYDANEYEDGDGKW